MNFPPDGYSRETATDGIRAWTEHGVARIAMARPGRRNAQDAAMLYGLDAAFASAMADDTVRVVVLSGDGPHFCAGHDLDDLGTVPPADRVATPAGGFHAPGAAGRMAVEEEMYLGLHRRWRDLAKPLIAMVHGHAVAGGLMTAWVCDLIVASEDARFCDPVIAMGMNAHEWFVHPWEFGARKAKELLFTGDTCTAAEALRMGMVNHVVGRDQLEPFTLSLARRIAARDPFALKLAKKCVNHALDAQGQREAVDHAFALHQLAHTHHQAIDGTPVSRAWLEARREGSG